MADLAVVLAQGRDPRRADGVGAVPGGLGLGPGQQLQHHRHPLRRPRQRLPGNQPAAQSPEETGNTGGERPDGGTEVQTPAFTASMTENKAFLIPETLQV